MKIRPPKFIKNDANSWFGEYAHRWPDAALPMAYAMACVEVVYQNSEKAGLIYKDILKAWVKPETSKLYEEVVSKMSNSEIKRWKELIKHPESVIKSDVNEPWEKLPLALQDEKYMKSFLEENFEIKSKAIEHDYPGAVDLLRLICEFILVGFNREIETKQGKYKVTPTLSPPWLLLSVMYRTSFESKNVTLDRMQKMYKVRKVKGKIYDFEQVLTTQPMSRMHREIAKYRQRKNISLRHDSKFLDSAWLWFQCRVVHSGIEAFLDSEAQKGSLLDLKNVQKDVKICDDAIGYQTKGITLD